MYCPRSARGRSRAGVRRAPLLALVMLVPALAITPPATATLFSVDSSADTNDANPGNGFCADGSGFCSLRAAVEEANAWGGPDTISLDVAGPYDVALGQLAVNSEMTILANGETLRLTAGGGRLIQVQSGNLRLEDATLRDGNNNGLGGAFHNGAIASLVRCTVIDSSNLLRGGAISTFGADPVLNIISSAIVNNSSGTDGGGIYVGGGTLNIANSTISGNQAGDDGGGIFAGPGTVVNATNVTVIHNTADNDADGDGAGGGIYNVFSTFNLRASIVADNLDTPGNSGPSATLPDIGGSAFSSTGHNLIGSVGDFDFASNTTGDHYGDPNSTTTPDPAAIEESQPIEPLLGGMVGGPPLHRLLDGSPALEQILPAECTVMSSDTNPLFNDGDPLLTDQEGDTRPQGTTCDKGADEAFGELPIFVDAFESGNTLSWSTSVP